MLEQQEENRLQIIALKKQVAELEYRNPQVTKPEELKALLDVLKEYNVQNFNTGSLHINMAQPIYGLAEPAKF